MTENQVISLKKFDDEDEEITQKHLEALDRRAEHIVYSFLKAKNTPTPAESICFVAMIPIYMAKYMSMMIEDDVTPQEILGSIKDVMDVLALSLDEGGAELPEDDEE